MARPTEQPLWGTDAVFAAIGKAWDGLANKTDPGAGKKAEGFEPTERPAADYLNWLFNRIYLWTQYLEDITNAADEHVYPTPKTRVVVIGPHSGINLTGDGWHYSGVTDIAYIKANVDNVKRIFNLTDHLPSGCTVTKIDALIKPGAAHTMEFNWVETNDALDNFPTNSASYTPGGSSGSTTGQLANTNYQRISFSGLSIVIGRDANMLVGELKAGTTASSNNDRCYGIEVTYTDVGPRNN